MPVSITDICKNLSSSFVSSLNSFTMLTSISTLPFYVNFSALDYSPSRTYITRYSSVANIGEYNSSLPESDGTS